MDATTRDPAAFLPLTQAEFQIMLALAEAEMHGYGIMQEIAARAGYHARLGPATLYRSLRRLLEADLIAEAEDRPDPAVDDERRRYYRLTPLGRQVARAEVERLKQLVSEAYRTELMYECPGEAGKR